MPPFFPNASPNAQRQHPPTPSPSNRDLHEEDALLARSPSADVPGDKAVHTAASAPHTGLLHPSGSRRRPNHTTAQDPANAGTPCTAGTGCPAAGIPGLSLCWWRGGHAAGSRFPQCQHPALTACFQVWELSRVPWVSAAAKRDRKFS